MVKKAPRPVRLASLVAAALVLATASPAAVAAGPSAPEVAYYGSSGGVRVASTSGNAIAGFGSFRSFSLQNDLFVGQAGFQHPIIVGYDLSPKTELFRVTGAIQPTVIDESGRVAFWGTGSRDWQNNSVWIRESNGTIRRIVQFSNGGSLPGHASGFGGDGTILSTSYDADGSRLALAEGNDVDMFVYDVFTVDTATRAFTRVTSDHRSRQPAVSPSGGHIVYQRDVKDCGAPYIRASRLVIANVTATWHRDLTNASCRRWLAGPRFVSGHEVVAYLVAAKAGGGFKTDLARVDVRTGDITRLTYTGDVKFFSADPTHNLIAYTRRGVFGFTVRCVDTGARTVFTGGQVPHLSGDHGTI